jgi:hypothetical protein
MPATCGARSRWRQALWCSVRSASALGRLQSWPCGQFWSPVRRAVSADRSSHAWPTAAGPWSPASTSTLILCVDQLAGVAKLACHKIYLFVTTPHPGDCVGRDGTIGPHPAAGKRGRSAGQVLAATLPTHIRTIWGAIQVDESEQQPARHPSGMTGRPGTTTSEVVAVLSVLR